MSVIYQDSGMIIESYFSSIKIIQLPDKSVFLTDVEKIIQILQSWIDSKQGLKSSLIVGKSNPNPKLLVNNKEKMINIQGIEFIKDGENIKISAKEYDKLQDIVVANFYG